MRADNVAAAIKVEDVATGDETRRADQAGRNEKMAFPALAIEDVRDANGGRSAVVEGQQQAVPVAAAGQVKHAPRLQWSFLDGFDVRQELRQRQPVGTR